MDQVIEVARHLPSEGVHHEVHPFLHHLHLCDYVRWSHICDKWTTCVLSFLVLSLSVCAFLIFLLSVKPYVLLAQLLFQIMVLLGGALHVSSESLNLSLKGGCAWFISLNIIGDHHRASKYHATFCPRSDSMAYKSQFPTDGANWWCRKSSISHMVLTCSRQRLPNKKQRKP